MKLEELESYKKLYDDGVITLQEFEMLKNNAINDLDNANSNYPNNTVATIKCNNIAVNGFSKIEDGVRIAAIIAFGILAVLYCITFLPNISYLEDWELYGTLINLGGIIGMCSGVILCMSFIKRDYSLINIGTILLIVFNAMIFMRDTFVLLQYIQYSSAGEYANFLGTACLLIAVVLFYMSYKNPEKDFWLLITILAGVGALLWAYAEGIAYEDGMKWVMIGVIDGVSIIMLGLLVKKE